MSESFQEKTEQATPHKRQESHRKGDVPRSQELTTAAMLLASAGVLAFGAPAVAGAVASVFTFSTTTLAAPPSTIPDVTAMLQHTARTVVLATLPVLAALAAVSFGVNAAQARGVLSAEKLKPKFSRLSPQENLKRIFGPKSLMELLKSLLKLVVVGTAMYFVLQRSWSDLMTLGQRPVVALLHDMATSTGRLLLAAGLAYIALAAIDYAFQVWNHEKQLRMTREEVKRETKEQEGDPLVKSRLRSLGRSLTRRQMFRDVPQADVVITNPTHIAVALRYDPSISLAPIVVAMGQRKVAERIRKIARENGVPVIENKPVARAIFAMGKVGQPIPSEMYVAVAEILAFVIRRRAAGAAAWAGSELA